MAHKYNRNRRHEPEKAIRRVRPEEAIHNVEIMQAIVPGGKRVAGSEQRVKAS